MKNILIRLLLKRYKYLKRPYKRFERYLTDGNRYSITIYERNFGELYYDFEDDEDIVDALKRLHHDENVFGIELHDHKRRMHYDWEDLNRI